MSLGPHPELAELSAMELAGKLARGETSAVELAMMSLERIAAIDASLTRSVIEVNPNALDIARRRDAERRRGSARGPLHGLPLLVKDNIETGDRMLTTAGSLAMTGAPASRDAPLVTQLRRAGAVLIGKTNLSEWANARSFRSSSGWSGRGRQTRNPHFLDRTPSGSSSGSGVAAAAGFAAITIGTETDGSIVSPSSACGIVGIKPGVGVVSGRGIVPIARSQDSAGPMTRTVEDAAAVLGVIAQRPTDFRRRLRKDALRGRRVGVLRQPFTGYSEHTDRCYEASLEALKKCGAALIEVDFPTAKELRESRFELTILLHELKAHLNDYLRTRRGLAVHTLADVIRWNQRHADEEMPYFRQEFFDQAQATKGLRSKAYVEARETALRLARKDGIDAMLRKQKVDALVAPSNGPAAALDVVDGEKHLGGSTQPSAVAGYPIITVPAGTAFGLPLGLSFFAGPGSEGRLLGFAYAFEQATRARVVPNFVRALELT
ncbi:MAG TPA: amidase [Candidatus Dormibacteraeota bacterium]|nr:amidase [Candidatus Dormibacteraeota bacterium]